MFCELFQTSVSHILPLCQPYIFTHAHTHILANDKHMPYNKIKSTLIIQKYVNFPIVILIYTKCLIYKPVKNMVTIYSK